MKDAASCDNPRRGAHILRPAGLRMGEPMQAAGVHIPLPNHIGRGRTTRGTETSKYPEERKSILETPPSSGERKGTDGQTGRAGIPAAGLRADRGCRAAPSGGPAAAPGAGPGVGSGTAWEGRPQRVDSPVREPTYRTARRGHLSRAGHVKPGPNPGGPPSKPEYYSCDR